MWFDYNDFNNDNHYHGHDHNLYDHYHDHPCGEL